MAAIFTVALVLGILGAIIFKLIELSIKRAYTSWEFEAKRVYKKLTK